VANEKHLYLVVGGHYEDSAESPEAWQFGIRLAAVFGSIDDIGTLPNNWDVIPESGTHTNGNWDTTTQFSIAGPASATIDVQSYMEDYVQPTMETFFGTGTTSTQVKLDSLKISPIGSNGKVILSRTVHSVANTDIHGDASGNLMPMQCSVVGSWRTGVVGRKGRGRIYLPPMPTSIMGAHGHLDSAWVGDARTNLVTLLEGLGYTPTLGPFAGALRPIVTGAPWTDYGVITEVRVGDLVDTQRRRRRQMVETYTSGSPTYA
jgi:hypothetical protein